MNNNNNNKLDHCLVDNIESQPPNLSVTKGPIVESSGHKTVRCCKYGAAAWCKKYWWEGQELKRPVPAETLATQLEGQPWTRRLLIQHRRVVGFCIPALLFHFFWWAYFIKFDTWYIFKERYPMTITMIFGSMIAGMTSEGGGAVAFPVMTLALNIQPSIARDFALMIQACGMSAASFTILFMKIRVEWNAILICSSGGAAGLVFGLHVVDPVLSSPVKKLGFVSVLFAFASVLIFLNRVAKRTTFKGIQNLNWWKLLVLLAVGFLGGVFTSLTGSGLDICSFMILTLLFRVTEKVATPTSIIVMAANSVVGFYWRGVMLEALTSDAWDYLAACLPIVVVGAPVGSVLGSHFHRLVLAGLVIVLDTLALVTAFATVRPISNVLLGGCVGVIAVCFCLFMGLTYAGQRLMERSQDAADGTSPPRGNVDGGGDDLATKL